MINPIMKCTTTITYKNTDLPVISPLVCSVCLLARRQKIMPDLMYATSPHMDMTHSPKLPGRFLLPRARLCQAVPHLGLTSAWQRNLHCLPESCL